MTRTTKVALSVRMGHPSAVWEQTPFFTHRVNFCTKMERYTLTGAEDRTIHDAHSPGTLFCTIHPFVKMITRKRELVRLASQDTIGDSR